jgi:nitroreductase
MGNDLLELIKKRHSTRAAFDPDKKVAKNDLKKILESATWSPTAHNMQNFNILVIDNKDLLEKMVVKCYVIGVLNHLNVSSSFKVHFD